MKHRGFVVKHRRRFVLTLRPLLPDDGATTRALRALLKQILRQHRFRCELVEEVGE